jgi:hypothetical protein
MELFILVIIYFTRIEYYHMTLVRVFLTVEAQYFLSEKGQRIHRMSATCNCDMTKSMPLASLFDELRMLIESTVPKNIQEKLFKVLHKIEVLTINNEKTITEVSSQLSSQVIDLRSAVDVSIIREP